MTSLSNPSNEATAQTKKDKQLRSTLYLREFSSRLLDVTTELNHIIALFGDKSMLNHDQISALKSLRNTIIPFLSNASKKLIHHQLYWLLLAVQSMFII